MTGRPAHLSPLRLMAGVTLPWAAYLIIRALTGSVLAIRYVREQKT